MKYTTRIVWAIVDPTGWIHLVLPTRASARRIVWQWHGRAHVRKLFVADLGTK